MAAWNDHSLLAAYQTAFGTPNTTDSDFVALHCERPEVKFEHELTELDLLTGQVGAAPERLVGRRSGSIRFAFPVEGLVSGYTGSEDPGDAAPAGEEVIPPWFCLIANALGSNMSVVSSNTNFWRGLGSSVSQYTGGGVTAAGTSTSAIVCDDATASNKVDVGQLVVAALSATDTTPQVGWVETKSGQTLTLFEASVNADANNAAHLYGTTTAYASSEITETAPITFRWVGANVVQCYDLEDSFCESFKISWESGAVPVCEFSYKFFNYQRNKLDGELEVPAAYNRIPQLIGSNNARATIDGSNRCGLENCEFSWAAGSLRVTKCHGSTNGISAVEVLAPRVRMAFSVLDGGTGDDVYDSAGSTANLGQYEWFSRLELAESISVGVYVGSQVGKILSMLIPNGRIVATPDVQFRDSSVAYGLQIEAAAYTADSTDTAETSADSPINSLGRVALG